MKTSNPLTALCVFNLPSQTATISDIYQTALYCLPLYISNNSIKNKQCGYQFLFQILGAGVVEYIYR